MLHMFGPDGLGMTCGEHRIRESVSMGMDGRVTIGCAGLAKVLSGRLSHSQSDPNAGLVNEKLLFRMLDWMFERTMRGTPRKRFLFGPEYSVSVSYVSDVAEAQTGWPPADEFPEGARSTRVDLADVVAGNFSGRVYGRVYRGDCCADAFGRGC